MDPRGSGSPVLNWNTQQVSCRRTSAPKRLGNDSDGKKLHFGDVDLKKFPRRF